MADTDKPKVISTQPDDYQKANNTVEKSDSSNNSAVSARRHTLTVSPIKSGSNFDPISINSHKELASSFTEVAQRFRTNIEFSPLLLINPVLAFKEINVLVSKDISHHILHTLQYSPRLKQRVEKLENSLSESLHEPPQPNNSKWVAKLLFNKLKISPLDTCMQLPAYQPAINSEDILNLQTLRPKPRTKNKVPVKQKGTFRIKIKERAATVRRMDLKSPAVKLEKTSVVPSEVTLEDLYFYKDQQPLIKDLLELGVLKRRSFPFHSGDSYRKIKKGEKPNAFRAWIRSVTFANIDTP